MVVEKKVMLFEIVLRKRKKPSIDEMKIKENLTNHQSTMQLLLMGILVRMMILALMFLLLD
jgi:hypothetical protein